MGWVVLITVPAGAATFLLLGWWLRMPELPELLGALRRKKAEG
jgi:hypothetical protein